MAVCTSCIRSYGWALSEIVQKNANARMDILLIAFTAIAGVGALIAMGTSGSYIVFPNEVSSYLFLTFTIGVFIGVIVKTGMLFIEIKRTAERYKPEGPIIH